MVSAAPRPRPRVDVVLPVHNEAANVGYVVEEIFERTRDWLDVRVIACEDGSEDETQEVLAGLAARFPLAVRSQARRRGYAGAVIEGLRAAESEWVLAMDADGQCDPSDIRRLWAARGDAEIVIGDRQPRCDSLGRRAASRAFGLVYRALFSVPVSDPSCPLVLLRRSKVSPFLEALGRMPFGFWWEFVATARGRGLKFAEVPIAHRQRRDGRTQVFSPMAMPRLALTQLSGLGRVWLAIRRAQAQHRGQ
jgi:dolichol-phosphate mannosyltransferase